VINELTSLREVPVFMEPEVSLQCLQGSSAGGTISRLNQIYTRAPHFTLHMDNSHVIPLEDRDIRCPDWDTSRQAPEYEAWYSNAPNVKISVCLVS
jgi:hypothetical protein